MKKSVKNENKAVVSETVSPVVAESPSAVASPAPAVTPRKPAVVTTMTDPVVAECSSLLDQVIAKIGADAPLNADEVRRATKMRKGGAEIIPQILALCLQHGVTRIGSLTVQEMSDELKRGDALVQVGLRGALVQKKLRESAMGAHGRSWQIATTMYTTLRRLAVDDPELALGLDPVQSFFQTKRTKGKVRANKKAAAAKKGAGAPEPTVATVAGPVAAAPAPAATAPAAPAASVPVAATTGHGAPDAGGTNGAAAPAEPSAVVASGAH